MKRAAAAACIAIAASFASQALAVEQENHVGVDLGTSILVVNGNGSNAGLIAGAHWTYGLTDAFNLMVEGAWTLQTFDAHPSWVVNGGAGVSYVLDVLRWVPYVGVLAEAYDFQGRAIGGPKLLPGATLAAGLDYRFDRRIAAGVEFRETLFPTDMSAYPSAIQMFGRLEYTWGW